jgi:hypothetical protein
VAPVEPCEPVEPELPNKPEACKLLYSLKIVSDRTGVINIASK